MISNDGVNYKFVDELKPDPNLKNTTDIKAFTFKPKNTSTRYIKFILTGDKKLPMWHPYKGSKAWIFVDEITVK